jgi:hypothetical protein
MPAQHQEKPGLESKVKPRPHYEAPLYRGSDKLKDKVALPRPPKVLFTRSPKRWLKTLSIGEFGLTALRLDQCGLR